MKTAEQIAEEAIEKLDDDKNPNGDAPADPKKGDPSDDKNPPANPKPGDEDDDKKSGDDAASDDKKPKDDDEEEGEFTADDALEVDDDAPAGDDPLKPTTDAAGIQLSPAESKHIVDNIGEPIVLRGMRGDKEVEIKAYQPGDIPADFKFRNDAELLSAKSGFERLEKKAEELLGAFRENQSRSAAQDFERRENEGIRQDVAELQQEGLFPKFKVQPGAKGFEDDPAAKDMADILDIMTKKNQTYLEQYNQGRPYKHIGFREAFDEWAKKNSTDTKKKTQDAEDEKRHDVGKKVGTGGGAPADTVIKPTVKSGTTIDEILARHEHEGI